MHCTNISYFFIFFYAGVNPDISYINLYKVAVYFWVLFGLAFMAAVINVVSDIIKGSGKHSCRLIGFIKTIR